MQDRKFRSYFRKYFLRQSKTKNEILPTSVKSRKIQIRNLSVEGFFKMSKSDSLDSNYSRATSMFGIGSRQSSQETSNEPNQGKNESLLGKRQKSYEKSTFSSSDLLEGSNTSELNKDFKRVQFLGLKRANAIQEVSPTLERSNLPNIIVHSIENGPTQRDQH